ncbi:LOB domain-containing protein 12-like [Diospyros lotus]|uniref:LOB domain-containing protein 12-like n=1 Tax=Diospyros lotus TaxID=55363 RepID=UPI00225223E2|nr:LOB domain-containing protein 12-like [Diospyros lotus]
MGGKSPCACCKSLRRRCSKDCIFAPYFPSDDTHKFATVHKVFGASNVGKILQEVPVHQRADAASSLVYEAKARVRDPVYGCVAAISYLQNQVSQLKMQLAVAQAEMLCIQMQAEPAGPDLQVEFPDDKSFFLQENLPRHLNLASSSTVIHEDSLKRDSLFGHDAVSSPMKCKKN